MSTYCGLTLISHLAYGLNSVLNVITLVGAFNQEKTIVRACSVIVKTSPKVR